MKNLTNLFKATLSLLLVLVLSANVRAACTLVVQANVNAALHPTNCNYTPTVAQLLVSQNCPGGNLVVQAMISGSWVTNPTFTVAQVNQTFSYRILDLVSGNSAMGNLTIKDITKPVITCGPNVTVQCEQTCLPLSLPTVSDCAPTALSYVETVTNQSCTSPNIRIVTRVYTAMDNSFNTSSCTKTYSIARRSLSAVVFPANVTMQVTGTDCTPWCETGWNTPNPSSTVNGLSFAPGTPTILGVPISPVQNPGACNGVCVPECGLGVSYADNIVTLCGTNRLIQRTWNVYSACGGSTTYTQNIKVLTDGNTNCGAACQPPTSYTVTSLGANKYKVDWNIPAGCPVSYQFSYRFKVGGTWGTWTTAITSTNTYTVTKPAGATECNVYIRTTCNGVVSPLSSLITFPTLLQEADDRTETLEGELVEMPETTELPVEPTVYPNPSTGEIFIDFKTALSENSQLNVIALDGRLVHTQTLPAHTLQASLDLGGLDNGLYLIQVQSPELTLTKKVQIIH